MTPDERKQKETDKAASTMQIKFRVVARVNVVLWEGDDYPSAEQFCWAYTESDELHIEKVWIQKRN